MTYINEAYIGKTGPLLEIERQIGRLRAKYMGKTFGADEVNDDIELIKLNRMFEKFTGFNPFCLGVTTENVFNAYTKLFFGDVLNGYSNMFDPKRICK